MRTPSVAYSELCAEMNDSDVQTTLALQERATFFACSSAILRGQLYSRLCGGISLVICAVVSIHEIVLR